MSTKSLIIELLQETRSFGGANKCDQPSGTHRLNVESDLNFIMLFLRIKIYHRDLRYSLISRTLRIINDLEIKNLINPGGKSQSIHLDLKEPYFILPDLTLKDWSEDKSIIGDVGKSGHTCEVWDQEGLLGE